MKKKVIVILFTVLIFILILFALSAYFVVHFVLYANVTHSDIKWLNLSTVQEVVITNDGKSVELKADSDEYDLVVDVFKNKRVKIKDDRVHFWNEDSYRIEFITDKQKYVLYGSPEYYACEDGEELADEITFVLYDYTDKDTMEYLYQIVTIPKSDFLKIF